MFRKEMKEKLKAIFGVREVSFDFPGDNFEQDVLFVDVIESRTNAGQGTVRAKVTGSIYMFSQVDKLPYGFFTKKLQQADAELKKDFFFHDLDTNALNSPARMQNISERRGSFVYLYSAQYDPEQGELTSVEFEE